jgi:hypothetical protein
MRRTRRSSIGPNDPRDDNLFSMGLQELDSKVPWPENDATSPASKRNPPPFDFERTVRFMAYPFIMTPLQHKWFGFLSKTFPLTGGHATLAAMKRVAFDQLLFAPVGMLANTWRCLSERVLTWYHRSRMFLHIHDSSRGRRQARSHSQVPGRLHPSAQGQLPGLATSTGSELPDYSDSVPDRECMEWYQLGQYVYSRSS